MSVCLAGWLVVCLTGWLVNTITAVNIYRLQQNFASGYYVLKIRLGLKMVFMATPMLVPPIQIDTFMG